MTGNGIRVVRAYGLAILCLFATLGVWFQSRQISDSADRAADVLYAQQIARCQAGNRLKTRVILPLDRFAIGLGHDAIAAREQSARVDTDPEQKKIDLQAADRYRKRIRQIHPSAAQPINCMKAIHKP